MKSASLQQYDLIIVGGGMVGAALACALADSTLKIVVIEGHPADMDWPEQGYDLRVSAITRASQRLFEQLEVWQAMVESRVSPYREMHVWDATGAGSIHFDCADIGEPDLGHIIENRIISRALTRQMKSHGNITLLCPAVPKRLWLRSEGYRSEGPGSGVHAELLLEDGQRLAAGLVIGADGANSWVRQQAGIEVDIHPYHQRALVTNVKTELSHAETAWQRFLPTGPLAFLPLTQGWSSIVWSTSTELAEELLAMPEAAFHNALGEAFDFKLGKVLASGPRAAFPLQGQHARQYVKPGLALIGDAAHTIHPLAGQGVNLGFADMACLADHLLAAHAWDAPLGSYKILRRYERSRKGENLLMLEAMGVFKELFSNPGLRQLRNLGLDLTDRFPPAKHLFMRQAMGISNPGIRTGSAIKA